MCLKSIFQEVYSKFFFSENLLLYLASDGFHMLIVKFAPLFNYVPIGFQIWKIITVDLGCLLCSFYRDKGTKFELFHTGFVTVTRFPLAHIPRNVFADLRIVFIASLEG